jgi:hypothetical protein
MQETENTQTQEAHTPDCEEPERTESSVCWTESVEDHGAQRSAPERTESSVCWTESVEDHGAQRSAPIPDTLRMIPPEDAARAAGPSDWASR